MRPSDRLFQIIQALRRRRLSTARQLAAELEVSERTVYRDVRTLIAAGVPIDGEAGVGYRLRGYDLPPLMFSPEEVEALVLGARIVESWADTKLAQAARDVLAKVEAILPRDRLQHLQETALYAPRDHARAPVQVDLAGLRQAVRQSRKINFCYTDERGYHTERTVRPLGMAFYGPVWLLMAWCELRQDFRVFRPDRMQSLEVTTEVFSPEPGRTLQDFLVGMDST